MSGPVIPEAVHKLCEGCGRSVLLAVLVLQPRRRLLCARCYLVAEYEHERHRPTARGGGRGGEAGPPPTLESLGHNSTRVDFVERASVVT